MRKLSLAALTALELPPEELIACAEKTGFDCVGLRIIPSTPTEVDHELLTNKTRQKACLDLLRDSRVKVEDIEIFRILPNTNIQEFKAAFEVGQALGAKSALIAVDDPDIHRAIDNLERLAELTAQYHILPHVEFMPWLHTASLKDAVTLINQIRHPNISILIDAIHFERSHSQLHDWALYKGTKPRYVQLCDTPTVKVADKQELLFQARSHRLAPGDGYIQNLREIMNLTDETTAISLEIPDNSQPNLPTIERIQSIMAKTKAWLEKYNA